MKIYIKHMVTRRCIMVVKDELERLGIEWEDVTLGEAVVCGYLGTAQLEALSQSLKKSGLELYDDKKVRTVEQIKAAVIGQIHYSTEPLEENFSAYLSRTLQLDYAYLSKLFAATQGQTLEHYIIQNKIEKVKELLIYEDLTVAEIAHRLHYSSAAHLSNQFKKVTGFTASYFKELKRIRTESKETTDKKKPL
ncbi:AraC family transcriptional regulator [Flaviaesturariibacter amylovorans]|uniref:HTH araC/xylS-type domain-containing protein n=1 Tax=Flaviaesturariibacter amylovorans TaxID=1084520 RepID=A0ABP8GVL5_9BACT